MLQMVQLCITRRVYSDQRRAFFLLRKLNSAADISKFHTFKWDPLVDEVLEAA